MNGAALAPARAAEFPLWPGPAPGEKGDVGPERLQPPMQEDKVSVTRLTDVTTPTLTVFAPPAERRNGTAVIICPGGGYSILATNIEGTQVAEWLNSLGVTAFMLKYRVPARKHMPDNLAPKQDAQRAVRLVRQRAAEWGVDPNKIGMLGFSAGGNLTAAAVTQYEKRLYDRADAVDDVSAKPNFAVLVYPAWLNENDELKPEFAVTPQTPPLFFVHASDDRVSSLSSVALYRACLKAGVPAELHLYAAGGHGFGMKPGALPINQWPARCAEWLRGRGLTK